MQAELTMVRQSDRPVIGFDGNPARVVHYADAAAEA
jgi:hypothetical protein